MAESTIHDTLLILPQIVIDTTAGNVWAAHLAIAVALAAACAMRRTLAILILAALTLVSSAMAGHAVDTGNLSIAIYAIHLAAAGAWLGALISLLAHIASADEDDDSAHLEIARVSRVAAFAVATIALTGAFTAWQRMGFHYRLLVDSLYGRTLSLKLLTASAVVLIGGYNRFRIVPIAHHADVRRAIVRTVSAECAILALVLWWSTMLANTPPPH